MGGGKERALTVIRLYFRTGGYQIVCTGLIYQILPLTAKKTLIQQTAISLFISLSLLYYHHADKTIENK